MYSPMPGWRGLGRQLPIKPLNKDLDLAAAGEANLLQIFFFADAKGEHLRLASLDDLLSSGNHGRLDAAAADRAADLAALAHRELGALAARCRANHRHNGGNGDTLALRAPLFYIRQNVFHCDASWLI